jgi:prophage regulatory protein
MRRDRSGTQFMTSSPETLLRRRSVEARTGLTKAAIYRLMPTGDFPLPVDIGPKTVAWKESEVNAWIDSRAKTTRITKRAPAPAAQAKG